MISPPNFDAKLLENYSLRMDESGAIRVGTTRITLDLIADEFAAGRTPEEIVYSYDVLGLADVYSAVTFLLKHPAEVSNYLLSRRSEAEAMRSKIEALQPQLTKRDLLARRTAVEQDRAPARQ